jgi:hypothetical protein
MKTAGGYFLPWAKTFLDLGYAAFVGFWIKGSAGDADAQARAAPGLGFDGEVATDEAKALLNAD